MLFGFGTMSAQGQMFLANINPKTPINNTTTQPIAKDNEKTNSSSLIVGKDQNIPGTFKDAPDVSDNPLPMRREGVPGELETQLGSEESEGSVNVYTTSCTMGRFKFSCDYLYNDEGNLIMAEPCWQWGKKK